MNANKILSLPFKEEQQIIAARYRNGEEHQIIVPPQLQLNQGMYLPDHIIEQEEFRPNYGLKPKDLIAFNFAKANYNKGIVSDNCVHFYLYDNMFQCLNNRPLRYTSMLMSYPMVISPNFSLYMNWTEHERRQSAWRNQQMARLWQINGIPVIFNVSWAGPDSFGYCIKVYPKHCVIAINCMGVKGDADACYFWHLGYEEVIKVLEPSLIVRYGDKMPGEYEAISLYYDNQVINKFNRRKQHGR